LIGYPSDMSRSIIAKYVTPWAYKREREEQRRIAQLRSRDGDNCRRCRRPIRFDLIRGHDKGPEIQEVVAASNDEPQALEHLCLCHGRCNADAGDNTPEVMERARRKGEAALFAKSRPVRKAG
jgi:5-methylcytosine-specific restriction endonuclease McrA